MEDDDAFDDGGVCRVSTSDNFIRHQQPKRGGSDEAVKLRTSGGSKERKKEHLSPE
ncbi:21528_t:CDS:2 [Rhizophagus irregularis]|nr:21528_t:CDS:2 [Rhizophagus irregularis]